VLLSAMPPERSPRYRLAEQIGSREAPVGRELGQGLLVTDGYRRVGGPSTTGHALTISSHGPDPAHACAACLTLAA